MNVNWPLILGVALPWVLLGVGIIYFVAFRKDWKEKIGQLIFEIIEKVKDGDLTWDEAYKIIRWIFAEEPSKLEVNAKIKALKASRR